MRKIWVLLVVIALIISCSSMYVEQAKVYIQQENWKKARNSLLKEVKNNPKNGKAYFLLGQTYAKLDSLERMSEVFDKAKNLSPSLESKIQKWRKNEWSKVFNKGVKLVDKAENYEEALTWIKLATIIDSSNSKGFKNLGFIYTKLDSTQKAINAYKKAVRLEPDDQKTLMTLSTLYMRTGKQKQAKNFLKKVIDKNPENVNALIQLGKIYTDQDKNEKAIDLFKRVIERKPKNSALLLQLGTIYYKQEDSEKALKYFNRALEAGISKEDLERKVIVYKGTILNELEKYEKAIPPLKNLLDRNPYVPEAWYQIAIAYSNTEKIRKGNHAFKFAEGLSNLSEKKYESAKESFKKALGYRSEHVPTFKKLKEAYENLGKSEKVKELKEKIQEVQG